MRRRNPEHGGVPWYLMLTIVASIGVGIVAYRVLRERRITAEAEAARAPRPAPRPVEPAPQPEAPGEASDAPTPEEPVAAETPPEPAGECDEVSCVLNNYEGACCAKYKRPRANPANGELPESLDRAMISVGIDAVKARVTACGDVSSATGKVKVSVKVDPDGRVSSATVQVTPDAALGDCVATVVQRARFAKTQTGGSFSYPFTF